MQQCLFTGDKVISKDYNTAMHLWRCAQVIAAESEEADKVKSVVSQEEAAASKEAAGVKAIKGTYVLVKTA